MREKRQLVFRGAALCAPQQVLWPGHRNVTRPSGTIGVKSM
jgi:hypothetical protein